MFGDWRDALISCHLDDFCKTVRKEADNLNKRIPIGQRKAAIDNQIVLWKRWINRIVSELAQQRAMGLTEKDLDSIRNALKVILLRAVSEKFNMELA